MKPPSGDVATRRAGKGSSDSDGSIPPGWDYDPSAWGQRLPIVGLALVGFGIATYLAAYQWDVVASVWEPLFGDGSRVVLNSSFSHILPVPDAALGAAGYLLDAITGAIGGPGRWRRLPWLVITFGVAVGPLGAASVILVILQPVVLDAFCTLCLGSAVISVAMIGPAMDEMLASLQHVKAVHDRGGSAWLAFWTGRAA
jgi:uncharacterized membrane protein